LRIFFIHHEKSPFGCVLLKKIQEVTMKSWDFILFGIVSAQGIIIHNYKGIKNVRILSLGAIFVLK
jgi:hypothetical protein